MKRAKEEEESYSLLDKSAIISFIIYLIISIAFFYLLNKQTQTGFGFIEIIFSAVVALFVSLLLIWNRALIFNNFYLGIILGFLVIISFIYSLYLRYRGPYSVGFTAAGVIVYLCFLIFYIFQARKN